MLAPFPDIQKWMLPNLTKFKQSFEKNNQEQKTVFFLGDFNIDLMHYNEHKPTNECLDSVASSSHLPFILFNLVDIQVIPEPLLTIVSVI